MAGDPTTIPLLIFSVVILTGFVLAQAPGRSPTEGRYIGDCEKYTIKFLIYWDLQLLFLSGDMGITVL
jgi:hypothetical protein